MFLFSRAGQPNPAGWLDGGRCHAPSERPSSVCVLSVLGPMSCWAGSAGQPLGVWVREAGQKQHNGGPGGRLAVVGGILFIVMLVS